MNYEDALSYINHHGWSKSRPGLSRTEELLRRLGDPQKELRFIHVAGTNGKGSTCAMLERILREAGFRTGFYPSPYLEDFRERIQVRGRCITKKALCRITEQVRKEADQMEDHPSQFELITAIGLLYFREQNCDPVILEVGMGGALDSTNVIDPPEAAILTNIGLDHTEYLGDTVEKIAETKCGIIKEGSSVISYPNLPSVMEIIRRKAKEKNDPLYETEEPVSLSHDLSGQRFLYKGTEYSLSLLGAHQLKNAAVVLESVNALRDRGFAISEKAVRKGLELVRWPARFEVLSHDPVFILDGGHNPQCAEALAEALRTYIVTEKRPRVSFLIGILKDKDYPKVLELLAPYAENYICITPENPRALKAEELAETIRQTQRELPGFVHNYDSYEEAITEALDTGIPVVAFGSLYAAGALRKVFPDTLKRWKEKTR